MKTDPGPRGGLICGFVAGKAWLVYPWAGGVPLRDIDHLRFVMIGVPVSLMTPGLDAEAQTMVNEIRKPLGKTILDQAH